ncbi:hypothetical protein ABPG75_013340 [Micractinium tetrahymenae]
MLKAFKEYRKAAEEEQSSLFLAAGFATPSRPSRNPMEPPDDYVKWEEVEKFLAMAEQALKARTARNEALCRELESARTERQKVEKTSSAAQEESSFLAEHMQGLLDERTALKEALEKAQREQEYLARENELLRQELLEGAALGEEGSAALQLLARSQEELKAAQARALQLENENVQLQARVSALEHANRAQATAMLSCLEESERVRLQQLSLQGGGDSPLGPLAAHGQRSDCTDDSSAGRGCGYAGMDPEGPLGSLPALDLRSEASDSFASAYGTPLGSASSSGAAGGSIFRSPESSPSDPQQQGGGGGGGQQAQQRQQPSASSARGGRAAQLVAGKNL